MTAEATQPTSAPSPISSRSWFVLALLAVTGQIAWAVENMWFNTFVYDELTPDPRPVAWMVAASAITPDWACRVADYQTFMKAELRAHILNSGVRVIGYRAIQAVMGS